MMLLSELTGISYATFDYRKTHTTKGEILHHVHAYPQGKFNFITRRNECHSLMLCSSSLSAQTSPPHHLELVFHCIRVYIPPVEKWEKKVQAAFISRSCESAMCARDNSTSFFFFTMLYARPPIVIQLSNLRHFPWFALFRIPTLSSKANAATGFTACQLLTSLDKRLDLRQEDVSVEFWKAPTRGSTSRGARLQGL